MSVLAEWQNFYVLVGSAAGALIGLQFVVLALIADMPSTEGLAPAAAVFGTPTVVHFSVVLLLSAALNAPWHGARVPALAGAVLGCAGALYVLVASLQLRRQHAYRPDASDWIFYVALPLAAYAALAAASCAAVDGARRPLFAVAAASLLLLFIGIRNAWDNVTYHVFVQRPAAHRARRRG